MKRKERRVFRVIAPCGTIDRIAIANTFRTRSIGLLARAALMSDEGMLFIPGGGIHTFGMRFAIDVVFLTAHFDVLDVVASVRPWRFVPAPRHTRLVLELRTHAARELGIVRGSSLVVVANRKQSSRCARR